MEEYLFNTYIHTYIYVYLYVEREKICGNLLYRIKTALVSYKRKIKWTFFILYTTRKTTGEQPPTVV